MRNLYILFDTATGREIARGALPWLRELAVVFVAASVTVDYRRDLTARPSLRVVA